MKKFLSKEEYDSLTITERNQLALNKYIHREKSPWEIGRDFERFIGFLYEQMGYNVWYFGIDRKLEDLGRDIIASNQKETLIIQCKYWSKSKLIHEKHIAQLFGTTIKYKIDNPDIRKIVKGVFITHTELSSEAKRFAEALNIETLENQEIIEYPMIKCNTNKNSIGEETRIYHLPMDQQYDRVTIDVAKGEFYAMTVQEAEDAGFRRAYITRADKDFLS